MRPGPTEFILAGVLATATLAVPAGEPSSLVLATLQPSDPCTFYRGQAYGKGVAHFATEVLWACQAIAMRRAADMPLGDRLEAAEAAIERYRAAVIAAAVAMFEQAQSSAAGARLGLSEAAALALADSTGALVALEGIRTGF